MAAKADVSHTPRSTKNRHDNMPVLSEARNADGTLNLAALYRGQKLWWEQIAAGKFHFKQGVECDVDWNNDILLLVRQTGSAGEQQLEELRAAMAEG